MPWSEHMSEDKRGIDKICVGLEVFLNSTNSVNMGFGQTSEKLIKPVCKGRNKVKFEDLCEMFWVRKKFTCKHQTKSKEWSLKKLQDASDGRCL